MSEVKQIVKETIQSGFGGPGDYSIIVRQDKPIEVFHPTPLVFEGNIDSPLNFLRLRNDLHNLYDCHAVVDRENMTITLTTEESSKFKNIITGRLEYDLVFIRLGINDGNYVTAMELSDRLRRHKTYFETLSLATEVVNKLKNFKARVNNTIEKANDSRGNRTDLTIQAIESINLPENFTLRIPIFKGQTPEDLRVEVDIKAEDLSVTLFSEDAYNVKDLIAENAINTVLEGLRKEFPELLILEK